MKTGIPVLCLAALLMGCGKKGVNAQAECAGLKRLHDLEKELETLDDPELASYEKLLAAMEKEAKGLLYLTSEGKEYRAAVVYFCPDLEDIYRCMSVIADDTIHLTEFPEQYAAVKVEGGLVVQTGRGCPDELPMFYTGDPSEMHGSGYGKIKKVPMGEDGALQFNPINSKAPQVLFAIMKGKGDRLHRKYVWVLEPRVTS